MNKIIAKFCFLVCNAIALQLCQVQLSAQVNSSVGLNKILTLQPGESDTSMSGIDLNPINDLIQVEFPPTVHVHRMYYSGVETFQGPIVHGGRHIVVARNPVTNETAYVDVMLPNGAPRVRYEPKRIVYIYPDQHVNVNFRRPTFLNKCQADVTFGAGSGFVDNLKTLGSNFRHDAKSRASRSRVLNSVKENLSGTKQIVVGASEVLGKFTEELNDSVRNGLDKLPGLSDLKSMAKGRLADREKSASELRGFLEQNVDSLRTIR